MPVTRSAKKALRRAGRQGAVNARVRRRLKEALKAARRSPTPKNISKAYLELDMAVKKKVIHKNKASRLKSRLTKLLAR